MRKTYVNFVQSVRISDKAVTLRWLVQSNVSRHLLGVVKWQTGWRRYCFFPAADTLYDASCLEQIAKFCADKTTGHKEERLARPRL